MTGRLVVGNVPLLRGHRGTPPDLVLRWNDSVASNLDIVVHLHGYSRAGSGMCLPRNIEPISGLDFVDPEAPSSAGRARPTLGILPRGNFAGGKHGDAYTFPALALPGALDELIDFSLARWAERTGVRPSRQRLILTAHSGGGAALMSILKYSDPDEVQVFDALYGSPDALITWAKRAVRRTGSALRVLFTPTPPGKGTGDNSRRVHRELCASTGGVLPTSFVVASTSTEHPVIARRYGWRLLADAAADLPGTRALTCTPAAPGPVPTPTPQGAVRAGQAAGHRYVSYGEHIKVDGTRAWRNNNPGNIVAGPFTRAHGALGSDGRFAVFPDEASGRRAIIALLRTPTYRGLTIAGAIAKYAPPSENNTRRYVQDLVRLIGLPETTVLSSLDERQLDTIAGAIRAIEGWRAGLEYTCADAPAWALPLLTCRGGTSPQPVPPAPPPTPSTHEQWDAVRAEPSDIVSVGGIRVHRMIAGRLQQMIQAAGRDGITLAGGGFRSPSAQVELRKKHCGPTSYDIYQKPSSQCHPPTARPGHSRHEQGLAIDFNTKPGVVPWLRANAARFGFVNLPSEPWHWSVDGR